jgi:uncharacterized cupin superfamily protein
MDIYNVFTGPTTASDPDDPSPYDGRFQRFGPTIGANRLGGTVYELAPGQAICPYHYEYGNEEWLLVLTGRPTLRTPEGQRVLEPGDVVCFPEGPEGAHKVSNAGEETTRVLMLSTKQRPDVSYYPDSGKLGVWTTRQEDHGIYRRGNAVDYFEGEARKE